jgi:hypothetical protein
VYGHGKAVGRSRATTCSGAGGASGPGLTQDSRPARAGQCTSVGPCMLLARWRPEAVRRHFAVDRRMAGLSGWRAKVINHHPVQVMVAPARSANPFRPLATWAAAASPRLHPPSTGVTARQLLTSHQGAAEHGMDCVTNVAATFTRPPLACCCAAWRRHARGSGGPKSALRNRNQMCPLDSMRPAALRDRLINPDRPFIQ